MVHNVGLQHMCEGKGSVGVTTSHLTFSVTSCAIMLVYVCKCVCVSVCDMFCISLPLEGSFSVRYTITLTGVLICKRGQDKCTCHSQPHGITCQRTGSENQSGRDGGQRNHRLNNSGDAQSLLEL